MAAGQDGPGSRCDAEASPFKEGDESSVDIYDGLDNGLTVPDNSAPNYTPVGNSLNLFDEILIEEGTAKEASYNELQAEYGKCQQQIKELMKKFKEIQAQNIILQNENQALKKNISALIKTARVEINRKDEEISNLHQRLSEFPNHRSSFTRAYLPGSTNGRCSEMCKTKESKFRPSDLGDSVKVEHRVKNDCSKDIHHSYSSHNGDNGKSSSEKRNTPYVLRYPPEELCNDGARLCLPNHDHSCNKDNRKEKKEMKSDEQYSRGNVTKYKREVHQSTGNSGNCNSVDSEEGNSDPHQKLKTLSEKVSKNELQQKSQSIKLKSSPALERRVERGVSSWEKQATGKDRCLSRELYADERSPNVIKKDIKTHDKDEKTSGQKIKPNEKLQEQPRRSGRGSSPHSKNEHSKTLHESRKCRVEESRKGRDIDCKRDRGANDHSFREGRSSPSNSSSREHKHARFKENSSRYEWETAHSKSEKHRTEEKRKRERDNQDENRHSRNERKVTKEISHQYAKEFKKGTDIAKSERNKSSKSEETSRVADGLKDHKFSKTKDHTVTKSKDLKLSFMEKLNLTLSPAKKQCLSPPDGLKTPSQKAADEGTAELTLQAEMVETVHPVNCAPAEQANLTLQVQNSTAEIGVEPALPASVSSENEALKGAAADPAQPEALPAVTTSEASSETLPEPVASQVESPALPAAAEVLVPDEMLAETLSAAAEPCGPVESEASAVAVMDLDHPEASSLEVAGSVAQCENLPVTAGVRQDDNVPAAEVARSEPHSESMGTLPESATEKEEEDKTWLAAATENSADHHGSQNLGLGDLEAKSSGDLESCEAAGDINETKPDSLMEVAKDGDQLAAENLEPPVEEKTVCGTSMSTSQSPDRTAVTDPDAPLLDQNPCGLEPDFTEISTTTTSLMGEVYPRTKERETNPVPVDDDSSILSIDLNHLRYIPKAISPLNSPMRPLAKALRMESPCKGLGKSYNKDLIPEGAVVVCPSKNLSKEVNKENQKPVSMSDEHLEMESQLSISSDEIEEGEIISSDEDEEKTKPERSSENPKIPRPKTPETRNLTSSPQNQKNKTVCCSEDNGKFVAVKVSTKKNGERHKNQAFRSSKDMKKNKTVSITCLEKIVQVIVEPSSVQEIMQMLRAIRKQMRKNYMKFKVHFPVQHFHRIIESAIINFTSLIKYLNFSKMSTLGETLKLNICDIIESKLKQVKKNAIVDRLFEQQVSDMKKQLWKFVDEQLDYLFDKIKRIIVKQCDMVKVGNESEEGKHERTGKQNHKISHKNDVQRSRKKSLKARSQKPEEYILSKHIADYQRAKGHHEKNKTDAPKTAFTKCLNSIDNTRNSLTKVQPSKENNLQGTVTPLKGAKHEKDGFQLSRDANKSDLSYELLTEQQASSLTFNLVSDAQMGEIFKSLLQGSDLLEKNVGSNADRHEWEFRTPEKQFSDSHKCRSNAAELVQEAAPKEVPVESRSVEDVSWPVVSPMRAPSLTTRLQMSVDPDVLDESCMFEVPTGATSCKEDECSLQKNKSLVSSILLEDLAVSLTIPSPLKSDAHLSFLKPESSSGSTPEGVLSAHYSEDALLEEEDATEQDIHLALESDNSSSRSSCSSSWTSRPIVPGFQCRPSLPMQAVIMEKSNDHFIVKIRRAVPSVAAASDQVASVKEARASSAKNDKEVRSGEKERGRQSAVAATVLETVKPDLIKADQVPYAGTGQEQNPALPQPLKESRSSTGKEGTPVLLGPCRKPSNTDNCSVESSNEGSEQSQTHKLKVSESLNETGVKSQALFPVGCGAGSCIDLTDDAVKETSCFVVESAADNRSQQAPMGNSEICDRKEELEECSDGFIDLTEELSNETVAGECNLEEKPTLNTDVGSQISIDDKNNKKRKKEAVKENSNSKRQRKETEVGEESEGSDTKSEEINLGHKQCYTKNNELQQNKDSSPLASCASSPSLYAKNIIKKKGEVVVSWTRNDDREILLECQRKGPSSKTFVSLATRLNKSPNQVSERFKQLMKLFKKSKCK
ncbi:CASP8-associated protein 2 isoform X1 [Anser cygnoides]|uniref:CASP8-associated protein 2 isoform X1 n=2 Tax=Anser cygnoides TaxID=8845 RepID=UPI0034D32DE3